VGFKWSLLERDVIYVITGVWAGSILMGLAQVEASWHSYALLGNTALLSYLSGVRYGAE